MDLENKSHKLYLESIKDSQEQPLSSRRGPVSQKHQENPEELDKKLSTTMNMENWKVGNQIRQMDLKLKKGMERSIMHK